MTKLKAKEVGVFNENGKYCTCSVRRRTTLGTDRASRWLLLERGMHALPLLHYITLERGVREVML